MAVWWIYFDGRWVDLFYNLVLGWIYFWYQCPLGSVWHQSCMRVDLFCARGRVDLFFTSRWCGSTRDLVIYWYLVISWCLVITWCYVTSWYTWVDPCDNGCTCAWIFFFGTSVWVDLFGGRFGTGILISGWIYLIPVWIYTLPAGSGSFGTWGRHVWAYTRYKVPGISIGSMIRMHLFKPKSAKTLDCSHHLTRTRMKTRTTCNSYYATSLHYRLVYRWLTPAIILPQKKKDGWPSSAS